MDDLDDVLDEIDGNNDDPLGSALPDAEDIPEKFRGKAVKDVLASYKEAEAKLTQQAQRLAELEKAAPAAKADDVAPVPVQIPDAVLSILFESNVDKLIAADPRSEFIKKHREQLVGLLSQVDGVDARLSKQAYTYARNLVVGEHAEDLVASATAPTSMPNRYSGVMSPMPKPSKMTDAQKATLGAWGITPQEEANG